MRSRKLVIYLFIIGFCFCNSGFCNDTIAILSSPLDTLITATDSNFVSQDIDVFEEEIVPGFFEKLMADKGLPFMGIVIFLMVLLYGAFSSISFSLRRLLVEESTLNKGEKYDVEDKLANYSATKNVLKILIPTSLLLYALYIYASGTFMHGYVMEWLNLLVRWAHVVAGIMWIGASFYFVFLENNLNRTKNIRDELAGNLWAVHGGGFYFLEKYKVAPKEIPSDLHWFKYEAYFTFITGMLLLVVVYYMDARAFLIDPSVLEISTAMAISIGVLFIIVGWIIYDVLCKSPLVKMPILFALIGFVVFTMMAYGLTHIFNARAAFIHMGAMIGAIMVGNVYFNIIPAQKAMVKAAIIGEPLDATLGVKAGQRSYHNNYFTLPVIFIMISNHFPSTFGHEFNWIVLAVISLCSAGIKHYWNLAEKGMVQNKILAISLVGLLGLAIVISPAFEAKMDLAIPVSFQEANEIIQKRCVQCHSANPSDDIWKTAPNGVMYDTPDQIQIMSSKIMTRAVRSKTMPQGNKTNMTDEERKILKRWIMQGSKITE